MTTQERLHEIIFEADTTGGKAFDIFLLIAIVAAALLVMLESVASIRLRYGSILRTAEWCLTILFTIEYILRLYCVRQTARYARSFFGIVDLVGILPSYLGSIFPGAHALAVVRIVRLLRIFRIFKMGQFVHEATNMSRALRASMRKIIVFLTAVLSIALIAGSLMYVVEGPSAGFTSIPRGFYWAIVTLTTVGFGDIVPHSIFGQVAATILMVLGYGIIAVPTGIVSADLVRSLTPQNEVSNQSCINCGTEGHDPDAVYCKACSMQL